MSTCVSGKKGRVLDDDDFDVACNESCKVQKCFEGCELWINAITSSCKSVCEEEAKPFNKNKWNLYCVRGCNIAINFYIQTIKDELGTPAQPYLVAETRTNDSITIKWAPGPYENISYLVQLRSDGLHQSTDWEYYKPSYILKDTVLKVEDLHPYMKYRFRVAWILLENYPPLFSEESIVISTLPYGAPSTAPTITCLTAVSASRISVSFDPPTYPNGPILSYVLYIREESSGNTMIKDVSDTSDGLHYMINNLKASTTYIISLSTRNAMGEGPADVRTVTTLSKKDSSPHHPRAFLIFAAKRSVLKIGLRILDESQTLYKASNTSVSIKGIALNVKSHMFYVSDSRGVVSRVNLKGSLQKIVTILHLSNGYPSALSLDWLNERLYMAEEKHISRCNLNGDNYTVVVNNLNHRPEDIHVDPLNGYLYWTSRDSPFEGGLYRIDLVELESGCVSFEKAQLIVSDYDLSAFAVDYKNFRLLLPSVSNNTIVAVSLDGSDVSDIRQNSQTHQYKGINSITVHRDLLYWTTDSAIFGEEYHKRENKYYQNGVYSAGDGPFHALNVYHYDNQPEPVPLNPVESVQALFGSDSAKIRWSNPRLLGGQGKGSWEKWLYEVDMLDHTNNLTVFGVNITGSSYDVMNLKPNATYSIRVRAYSHGGKGPWSSQFKGSTLAKSAMSQEFPRILWGAREGLIKSDFVAENVQPLIHKINLNNAYVLDVAWYNQMLFINTNATFVYAYNTSVHHSLTRLQNITMATSIAIDWFAPKIYWSSPTQQMISRSDLDGSHSEPLPILTMAKEISVDSLNAFLYWATSYSVEYSRLNGADHSVYMKNELFSGKHVMGVTLDLDRNKVYWMVRSYEGSKMYAACMAHVTVCHFEEPEMVSELSEDRLHGPLYFSNRLFWLDENERAFVSDINGKNFAHITGLGLHGLTSINLIDPSLQPYPDGFDHSSIQVVPHVISENNIFVKGTWDKFNISWSPVQSVNFGMVFYEITVDDGDEVYNMVTNETVFVYPSMKNLAPYTPLTIAVRVYTYWSSARSTMVIRHSPMSVPSMPTKPRIFISHQSSPLDDNQDIIAIFRWSQPEKPNGVILHYIVNFWPNENSTESKVSTHIVDGKKLQFQTHLLPKSTYFFKVRAVTSIGEGVASDIVKAETSIERPVPQLLLAKVDGVKVADIDSHEEKVLYSKTSHPAAITYLAHERRVFLVEEGALLVSSLDGSNTTLIKHLNSDGTCLTVDWIGRQLYWAEVDKKHGSSSVWSVDLSYNNQPKQIFNRPSIISSLEVEPFSRSLIWTLNSRNSCSLMISDVNGSKIRPFFWRTLEYETTPYKVKVKRMTEKNISCNCSPSTAVGEAITVDSTNTSNPQIIWVDAKLGHIWSSDIDGCFCRLLLNASLASDIGLPPSSLTVDSTHLYWSNENLGKVYSIEKCNNYVGTLQLPQSNKAVISEDVRGIRSIRAIGDHLQPYPDITCLRYESYKEAARLISRTSNSLSLYLPQPRRPKFCSRISFPLVMFTVLYSPTDAEETASCFELQKLDLCKTVTTYNDSVVIPDLDPFKNYTVRVSIKNYYSEGIMTLGPEAIFQTEEGAPTQPTNVTAVVLTPFRIDVSWQPPLFPNGDLISYEIRLKVMQLSTKIALPPVIYSECGKPTRSDLFMKINTTEAGKDHFITVRAYSSKCDMYSDSDEIQVKTYELPQDLILYNATSTSLLLSWVSPSDSSTLYHVLEYKKHGESKWHSSSKGEKTDSSIKYIFLVESLTPKTKYLFRLILTYRRAELIYPKNSAFEYTTSGDVPSVPGEPELHHMKSDLYEVVWEPAFNYGYEQLFYELQIKSESLDAWMSLSNTTNTQYIVEKISGNINYEFRVRAVNEYGESNFSYSEKPFYVPELGAYINPAQDDSIGVAVSASVVILVLVCGIFATLYIIRLKKEKCKKLQEATPTNPLAPDLELATLEDLPLHANFVHQTNALYNLFDMPSDEELITLPQIKRDQIILTKFLGSGAFGEVFEGIAYFSADVPALKIAIKTLKKGATDHEKEEFVKEAKLMSHFKHDHILQLLGVCFDNNPNLIILELMEGGDLLSYLRSNRPTVFESSSLSMDDLLRICIDVAMGCKYLEDLHFVHRDLAARNCLVSSHDPERRIVKIGDFGLARDIYKSDYYRKEGEGLLPVRWMSPESLLYGVFTSQSDVWAFGVLLWEVMTLGQQPYPARSNMEVLHYVRAGGLLEKPESCPDELHQVMLSCWNYEEENRPTFCYCLHKLQELRNKLPPSILNMPAVCNLNYIRANMGFDNLGYCGSEITEVSIVQSSQNEAEIAGEYLGMHDVQNVEEDKLIDENSDLRSTQSDPAVTVEMPEASLSSMRRSASWTNTMFGIGNDVMSAVRTYNSNRPTINKYLELLGDNEDSEGYQVPVQCPNPPKRLFPKHGKVREKEKMRSPPVPDQGSQPVPQTKESHPTTSNTIETSNVQADEKLDCDSAVESWKTNYSSIVEERLLENSGEETLNTTSSSESSENLSSGLEGCDSWSLSTASTATCPMDSPTDVNRHSGISTLSGLSGIDLNYVSKSSYC
ncbi:proto-oncogene tyrosine-protein kinase ROS-like [Uloborus diversus]|uniref:proto-oncogene tyrosine-protein kinase ROS-like n=1 Tax=Uloborus diversus TaxID=327109 RepID=UPI00240A4C80|nr:proto-oncogene tyrosine-protein kinase ROS-like [Uloborus diversus]